MSIASSELAAAPAPAGRLPASAMIEAFVRHGGGEIVTVDWLLKQSPAAARDMLMLILALTALIPGASLPAGVMLIFLAVPMVLARDGVWLPRYVASHPISMPRLVRLVDRVLPVLRWQERMIHPIAHELVGLSRPLGALLIVALSATLLVPLPFSNVPPALAISMLMISYLETSGILLGVAALSGILSLAVTGGTVWAALTAAHLALG
jgi:hypothetical protein